MPHQYSEASAARFRTLLRACLCICTVMVGVQASAQVTHTYGATNVTFINSRWPNNNNGGSTFFILGQENFGGVMRGLVKFTMPSASHTLSGRVTVNTATLTIFLQTGGGTGLGVAASAGAFPLTVDWTQGSGAGTGAGVSGGLVGGVPYSGPAWTIGVACANGATWNQPTCSGSWTAGGPMGSQSGTAPATSVAGGVAFVSNGGMEADVKRWIDTGSNLGWELRSANEGTNNRLQYFSKAPTLAITYTCASGFQANGDDCTSCTTAAKMACVDSVSANGCVDSNVAGSTAYTCTCGFPLGSLSGWRLGPSSLSCVPACTDALCQNSGVDPGATCDNTKPSSGYTCNCTTGHVFNGIQCVVGCNAAAPKPAPCGNNGTCNITGTGTWGCTCPSGWKSNNLSQAACIEFDGCFDGIGNGNCVIGHLGNACHDATAPSLSWTCTCGNAAYVNGTDVSGNPACVNKDECSPTNHCKDAGDVVAVCNDHLAPATGYDCTCSSPTLFTPGVVGGFNTCVDTNECAAAKNPCLNGTCTNIAAGGGYSCNCDPGYIERNGTTPSPSCAHPDSCGPNSAISCVTAQKGNTCVDNPPPHIGFTCSCGNPAYVPSVDGRSCVDKNDCATDHCGDGGDRNATCVDHRAPKAGYECTCSTGFSFDGTTCTDIDECVGGANPCGHGGTCSNTKGGYQCSCHSGFAASSGPAPTCVATVSSKSISYTSQPGDGCDCSLGAGRTPRSATPLLLVCGALIFAWRRRRDLRRIR